MPLAGVDHFALLESEPPLVVHDIAAHFCHKFRQIGITFFRNSDWPGADMVDLLVKQACGLFLWAATAYHFVKNGGIFANDRPHAAAVLRPHLFTDLTRRSVVSKQNLRG
jgi:hypothetical protein